MRPMLTKSLIEREADEEIPNDSSLSTSSSTPSYTGKDQSVAPGGYTYHLEIIDFPQYVREDPNFLDELGNMIFKDWNLRDKTVCGDRVEFVMDNPVKLTYLPSINQHIRDIFETLKEDGEDERIPYVRPVLDRAAKPRSNSYILATTSEIMTIQGSKSTKFDERRSHTNYFMMKDSIGKNQPDKSDSKAMHFRATTASNTLPLSAKFIDFNQVYSLPDTLPEAKESSAVPSWKKYWDIPNQYQKHLSGQSAPAKDFGYIPQRVHVDNVVYPKITVEPLRYHYHSCRIIKFLFTVLAGVILLPLLIFLELCPKRWPNFYAEPMRKINETLLDLPMETRRTSHFKSIGSNAVCTAVAGALYLVLWLSGFFYSFECYWFFNDKTSQIWPMSETGKPCADCVVDVLFPMVLFFSSWVIVSFWVWFSKTIENNPRLSALQDVKLFVYEDGFEIASFDIYAFLKKRAFRHLKLTLIDKQKYRKRCWRKALFGFIYTRYYAVMLGLLFSSIPLLMRVRGIPSSWGAIVLVSVAVIWSFVNMYVVSAFLTSAKSGYVLLLLEWTRDITALLSIQYSKERELPWVFLNTPENIIAWFELRSMVYKKTIVEIYRVEVLLIVLTLIELVFLMFLVIVICCPSQARSFLWRIFIPCSDWKERMKHLSSDKIFYALLAQIVFVIVAILLCLIQFLWYSHTLSHLWQQQSTELTIQRLIILQNASLPVGFSRGDTQEVVNQLLPPEKLISRSNRTINTENSNAGCGSSDRNDNSYDHYLVCNLLSTIIDLHDKTSTSVHICGINTSKNIGYKITFLFILICLPSIMINNLTVDN